MTGPWPRCPSPSAATFGRSAKTVIQVRSTILTSQLAVSRWHEQIGDPTLADGILDRLVHNAHRIEMKGDSMRKNRGKVNT
jgi:DNA replication protein DnaC